jgi:hypothetical protein
MDRLTNSPARSFDSGEYAFAQDLHGCNMAAKISISLGIIIAFSLVLISLWAWQQAPHLQMEADKPEIILWAVRTASVAAAALAQTVLLVLVIGNIYRTRAIDVLFRFMTAMVFAVSLVSAIALGLAGR